RDRRRAFADAGAAGAASRGLVRREIALNRRPAWPREILRVCFVASRRTGQSPNARYPLSERIDRHGEDVRLLALRRARRARSARASRTSASAARRRPARCSAAGITTTAAACCRISDVATDRAAAGDGQHVGRSLERTRGMGLHDAIRLDVDAVLPDIL